MTYEEKLDKIVSKLVEERKLTRKGHKTKVAFNDRSFIKVRIQDICKLLLQLQDDEKIIKIIQAYKKVNDNGSKVTNLDDNYEFVEFLKIEIGNEFDDWYAKRLITNKSRLENLSRINFDNICHIMHIIEQGLELDQSEKLTISFITSAHEIEGYEPEDIDDIINTYVKSLTYLKNIGVVKNFTTAHMTLSSELILDVVKFFETLEKIKNLELKKLDPKPLKPKSTEMQKNNEPKVYYDKQQCFLKIKDKEIKFKKDSFRAKLVELLLKDKQSQNKEWSWDEILEEIEGIKDIDGLKKNKRKFYSACDGLSKFIAQKTGVNDLLIFNKSTVQINPKHL